MQIMCRYNGSIKAYNGKWPGVKKIISDQDIFLYKCQHIVACKKSGHNIWDKVYV